MTAPQVIENRKTRWKADPELSSLTFKVKHFMISRVTGSFNDFQLHIETDGDDFRTARIELKIVVSSILTGVEPRDAHLRTGDFFDVQTYPYITFKSTFVEQVNPTLYRVHGELTIKNTTRTLQLEVEYSGKLTDPHGNVKAGFSLNTKINRFDYGLQWDYALQNSAAVVGADIAFSANIVVIKQQDENESSAESDVQSMLAAYHTQQSQLPDIAFLHNYFPQSFLFFKSRDLVGGDFYWFDEIDNKIVVVVADATGHGMEGSLKAMMAISMLNQIVSSETVHQPREILLRLHQAILASVRKSAGMRSSMLAIDAAIVIIDPQKQKIDYIGAGIPLYIYKGGELVQVDAYRFSAGSHFHAINDLNSTCFSYQAGDTLFLASDGFKDQYGGGNFKKMGVKRFRTLLESAAGQPFDQIPEYIQNEFTTYKGWVDQMDDVTLLSIRF